MGNSYGNSSTFAGKLILAQIVFKDLWHLGDPWDLGDPCYPGILGVMKILCILMILGISEILSILQTPFLSSDGLGVSAVLNILA